ncbi:hypothetical protein ACP70R_017891 [Stipagrostis hirtigluma subsp. patula]
MAPAAAPRTRSSLLCLQGAPTGSVARPSSNQRTGA